jgi:hypothetical protein
MAKAINTFLKSKMNKDLDARLVPNGEYRDAYNIQVSRSDGDGVGTVENILGNYPVFDFEAITGVSNLYCIGHLEDDNSNTVFLFLTDNPDPSRPKLDYYPLGVGSNHFIFACNPSSDQPVCLVKGPFLNFSQKNPIYGVNLLEKLLFWTDNRNQPRKINIDLANPTGAFTAATYYTTEDQISVAKYNPYACMELYEESYLSSTDGEYESTMYDVSSLYYPNGGAGNVLSRESDTVVRVTSFKGDIQTNATTVYDSGATVSVLGNPVSGDGLTPVAGATVQSATYNDTAIPGTPFWEITITGGIFPTLNTNEKIVLNPNPYYDIDFSGDADFLEDKFVRFSYRFRFDDNEYSVFAPFTQIAFIPKQDGYFMYVKENTLNLQELDNQADAYRSTVVYFVENKIDKIKLRIPLPFLNYNLQNSLKIKEVDILYKESDSLAVKVVDTITINDVSNSAGSFTVNGAVTNDDTIVIDNLQGGVNVGDIISGTGIVGQPKVSTYTPTDVNNPSLGGTIVLDTNQTLEDDANLQAGEPSYYVYNYLSKKPFKTLPEKDLTRVYDVIPVRSLSQEVAGNRVIYGNYQDKHTPPKALNYNVAVSNKSSFQLNEDEGTYIDGGRVVPSGDPINIDMNSGSTLFAGRVISSNTPGVTIPPNTLVSSTNNNGEGVSVLGKSTLSGTTSVLLLNNVNGFIPVGATVKSNTGIPAGVTVVSVQSQTQPDLTASVTVSQAITFPAGEGFTFTLSSNTETIISLNNEVTFPSGVVDLYFEPESSVVDYTSIIEYPNSSLKQNRNYQAGVILSDRFSRTSTVILSNNKDTIRTTVSSFSGSTIYSPYNDISQTPSDWPGDSIKLLFNEAITSFKNSNTGTPGLYNGDPTSVDYNPLGWYSFKIVVKQTEQEYYNVYLPGIMASYPDDATLELGNTSHTVLINDNINKIPRDLSEVGPQQKQFRSSVQLYGRVENTNIEITPSTNLGKSNTQYYPGRSSDTVSTISTLNDLFEYDPSEPPRPNYFPQFYLIESNPLVARISTESKIGQISTTNFNTITASIAESATTDTFRLVDIAGDFSTVVPGDIVLGRNFPEDLTVVQKFESTDVTPPGGVLTTDASPASGEKQIKVDNIPTSGAGNGTLVSSIASGIPNGTAITNITGTSSPYTIELNNTVNVNAGQSITYATAPQLEVSSAQTVTLDQDITIIPDSTPGIQYLAIYETKPVESLLDIFWETSSSGLISDLNNAIINDSSAGAGLSEWNQTPFTEGLAEDANVLSAPFFIIDNFGSLISINDIDSDLLLTEVVDGAGENRDNYFTLVQTLGENQFQIQATTDYYNDIYFGEEDSSSPQDLRNFSLRLQATVNNQPLDVTRELILANERPEITFPSDGAEINTINNVVNITTINCVNGADNLNLRYIFHEGNCTIVSQTIAGQTEQVDYFAILPQPTIVNNEAQFQLVNTNPSNVPVERYRLEICVEDAGGTNDRDCIEIFIDFGVKIQNVKQYCVRRFFKRNGNKGGPDNTNNIGGGARPDYWYQFYTVFQAYDGGDSNAWGWYLYNGPWSTQSREDVLGSIVTSTTYGVDNFPNAFINTAEYQVNFQFADFEYPGIPKQTMKGTEQDPLVENLGGNGVITIEFADVNTNDPDTGYNESFRWVPISEQESDVIQLWEDSSEIRAWCFSQFPNNDVNQKGNYSKFTIEDVSSVYQPNAFNPAPNDPPFYPLGWNLGQSGTGQNNPIVLINERDIDENNYNQDAISWQIIP